MEEKKKKDDDYRILSARCCLKEGKVHMSFTWHNFDHGFYVGWMVSDSFSYFTPGQERHRFYHVLLSVDSRKKRQWDHGLELSRAAYSKNDISSAAFNAVLQRFTQDKRKVFFAFKKLHNYLPMPQKGTFASHHNPGFRESVCSVGTFRYRERVFSIPDSVRDAAVEAFFQQSQHEQPPQGLRDHLQAEEEEREMTIIDNDPSYPSYSLFAACDLFGPSTAVVVK
jgi:hypothetical protein